MKKVRNKKTDEILECDTTQIADLWCVKDGVFQSMEFSSIKELVEEWEDYEESENFYIVERRGTVGSRFRTGDEYEKMFKEIGNYFETKEEAEKAVEKLKAIRILKDYDLHIEWANTPEYDEDEDRWYCSVGFSVREGCNGDILFNLLFGGEDE